MRVSARVGVVCLVAAGAAAQPSNPSREYIRLGARVIAIENPPPALAAPTFTATATSSGSPITVTINSATGTNVNYSLNGPPPTAGSGQPGNTVTVTISHTGANTLQAIAYAGTTVSPVASATYTIDLITAPTTPTGSASPVINTPFSYCTGGSTSGQGEAVQYEFDWGDMTNSGWLAAGANNVTCASHTWTMAGTYSVKATARSATNTWAMSPPSAALTVTAVLLSASLSISKQTFTAGEGYTVWLYTNLPNYNFDLCGSKNGGAQGCSTYTTDSSGNWKTTGWFTNDVAGNWQETVVIDNAYTNGIWFSITAAFANFSIGSSTFYDTDSYTLNLSTNLLSHNFTFCLSHNNGAWQCYPNYAATNSGGSWSLTGSFNTGSDGAWQEYLQFVNPDGSVIVQSNTISFNVQPPASLYINATVFGDMNPYTLWMTSNHFSQGFSLCANRDGSFWGCASGFATDGNGNWSLSSYFDPGAVGSWVEWVVFADGTVSNGISFTVSP